MEVPAKFRSVSAGFRYWLLAFIFMATSMFIISCGSGGTTIDTTGGGGVGGDTSFELTYLQNVITGGTTSISAYVTQSVVLPEGGTGTIAAPGVLVSFEIIENLSGGSTLNAASVQTEADGRASVTYTAGPTDGVTDTVRVRISGIDPQDALITVNPPGVGTTSVTVSADPVTLEAVDPLDYPIPAIITNQATISATLTAGGTAQAGETVSFTTTSGTLCDWPNCTAAASSAQTDTNGIARITLQSSTNLGTATVEAQYGSTSGSTSIAFIAGPAFDFTLSATPPNLTADGSSTSTVTAVVADAAGHIVADNTEVNFSLKNTSEGSGSFVEIPPTDNTVNGVATVTFKAGTDTGADGSIDIRASSGGVDSDDIVATYGDSLITLITEFVGSVTLTLNNSILTANGTDFTVATATVLNSGGIPVNPATPVTFTTTGGDLDTNFAFPDPKDTSVLTETLGDLGQASLFLRSSLVPGQYTVSATAGSKSAAAPVTFEALPADASNSFLNIVEASIPADGTTTATIQLTAHDIFNSPVADGKTVEFTTTSGTISGQTTTLAGVATATLTSSLLVGTVTVNATIDGITLSDTIDFTAPTVVGSDPNTIQLDLSDTYLPLSSPSGSDFIEITATVFDVEGNPVGDCSQNIEFSIDAGPPGVMLDGSTATAIKSTTDGVASVLLTAGTTPGTVTVQVSATKAADCTTLLAPPVTILSTAITIASGPAVFMSLFPDVDLVDNQDGSISMIMSALVTDAYANPVVDGTVVFFTFEDGLAGAPPFAGQEVCPAAATGTSAEAGSCVGVTAEQDGVARTLLTWPSELTWTGYTLYAETQFGGVTDSYTSIYPAIEGVTIVVSVTPPSVTAGTQNIDVTARYQDGVGNDIYNRDLYFTSNSGLVTVDTTPVATNIDGYASTTVGTANCSNDATVTITASDAPFSGDGQLTIQGTEPTASFTNTNNGTSFTFTNTSTEPPGYSYTYAWDFGDTASGTSTLVNPTYDYGAGESGNTLTVTLTVTSDAPGACSDIITGSVTVP
ncbi:MAG: invasin domain 3-containing protein [Thermodesulfobacteriota bacterium]